MFRTYTFLSFLTVILLSTLWIGFLSTQIDTERYSKHKVEFSALTNSEQTRKNVVKDLWIVQANKDRLHHKIESSSSLLTLKPKGSSIEIIEYLTGVRCFLQEKIQLLNGETSQQMRFFIAKEGIYHYQNQSFEASDVLLSMYKIPGRDLPLNLTHYHPFLKGSAENVEFSLENGKSLFKATRFKASSGKINS